MQILATIPHVKAVTVSPLVKPNGYTVQTVEITASDGSFLKLSCRMDKLPGALGQRIAKLNAKAEGKRK